MLVSSQTAVKCGHGFGDHSQDGELARWELGRNTKWRSCYAQKRLRNAKPGNYLKYEISDKMYFLQEPKKFASAVGLLQNPL